MNSFLAACVAEFTKARRSKVLPLTIAAMCIAPLFGAVFIVVLRDPALAAGNEGLRAKAALMGFNPDWPSYFNLLGQSIGVGGIIVFGFVTSWVFGREYTDRTMKELLCFPVRRSTIVWAKFATCLVWCLSITVSVLIVGSSIAGLMNLPGWDSVVILSSTGRVLFTAVLAFLLCPPVALVASVGRGYLAALGYVILTVVFAQVLGALGLGVYVPWAVPAIYSGMGALAGGAPDATSFFLLALTGGIGAAGTLYWWNTVDHSN